MRIVLRGKNRHPTISELISRVENLKLWSYATLNNVIADKIAHGTEHMLFFRFRFIFLDKKCIFTFKTKYAMDTNEWLFGGDFMYDLFVYTRT